MTEKTRRILVVDDHVIMRQGIETVLSNEPNLEVVASAGNSPDAIRLASELAPELIIMDIAMPVTSGIDATREILKDNPDIKVVMLSAHTQYDYVLESFRAGASGYVTKDDSRSALTFAIESVGVGRRFMSPIVADSFINSSLDRQVVADSSSTNLSPLTPRETQVLKMIASANSTREIANRLSLSVRTVEKHRSNIMGKLGLRSTAAITLYAVRNSLLDQDAARDLASP